MEKYGSDLLIAAPIIITFVFLYYLLLPPAFISIRVNICLFTDAESWVVDVVRVLRAFMRIKMGVSF